MATEPGPTRLDTDLDWVTCLACRIVTAIRDHRRGATLYPSCGEILA